MQLLDLTLETPEANLACEEVLLDLAEAEAAPELLRFWEPARPFVVLGHGNRIRDEVNLPACDQRGVPTLRRCSGGGTVVQCPGCLNYALILRIPATGPLQTIAGTNRFVLDRIAASLQHVLGVPVGIHGHTDLTLHDRKFAGNAQRRKRRALLFHGTVLLHADLALIAQLLPPLPPRQPAYRRSRAHGDFLVNLHAPTPSLKAALLRAWPTTGPLLNLPAAEIGKLAAAKYASPEWTWKF